jgi:2-phosphosulfolactate phosphatase
VRRIYPVSSLEEGFALKITFPDALMMGEVHGYQPPGFDFGNSPASISQATLHGRTMIQRTSAGTQGLTQAFGASDLFAASFVVAKVTAEHFKKLAPDCVTFIITGASQGRDGDEDLACAAYIRDLIEDVNVQADNYTKRVWSSSVGNAFLNGKNLYISEEDIQMCMQVDLFPFYLKVHRDAGKLVMEPVVDG